MTTRLELLRGVFRSTALCLGQNPGLHLNPGGGAARAPASPHPGGPVQQVATDHRLHGEPCCPQMPVWPKLSQPGGPVTKRGSGKREGFSVFYVWVMVWPGSLSPWPNWGPENSQFSSSRPLLRNRNIRQPQVRLHLRVPCQALGPRSGCPAPAAATRLAPGKRVPAREGAREVAKSRPHFSGGLACTPPRVRLRQGRAEWGEGKALAAPGSCGAARPARPLPPR